ncbi:TetR/AcrR family transcriptional regulator [Paucisalibacillus globulus]|uniref:TetR/AcrR family transcriptional regulator n=1 Tax=Paucisalibacillus globulus TaxID=351095 RepID=UPI000BB67EBF|nr:TetR/AcrR family transcriptional regulator [Paucisalibacillus globulus]
MNERKRKVANIALNLFIEKGFQQTSIQEIINSANISKGTFYNYFTSKNDCIAEILENIRYEASQQRVAMQIGKDPKNREVLIEQITIIMKLNKENNLQSLFENILSTNQVELKKLVLQHRVIEMEWLANRLVDVLGEDIQEYATEATVLFFGMLHYMTFTLQLTNSDYSLTELTETIFSYVEILLPQMEKRNTTMINNFALDLLQKNVHKKIPTKTELVEMANQLIEHYEFNEEQQDMIDVILDELQRDHIRKIVVKKLLKPLLQLFEETPVSSQVQLFTNEVWKYMKSI